VVDLFCFLTPVFNSNDFNYVRGEAAQQLAL
jgi:hypothetical protein